MPAWAQVLVIAGLLLFLCGAYLGAMQLLIDVSRPDEDPDTRDLVYLYLHTGFLLVAAILGFMAGRWVSGAGLGACLLVVTILATAMVVAHLGSRAVNCNTGAEVVRHWTC